MNANTVSGLNLFREMWSTWEDAIPQKLSRGDPRVLLQILEMSATAKGISHVELQSELGINQSRLSKLTTKLRKAGWVKVSTPPNDRRKALVKTSAAGKALLADLHKKMEAAGAAPSASPDPRKARKGIREAAGQIKFDLGEFSNGDSG